MSPAGLEGRRRGGRPRDGRRVRRTTWATSSGATRFNLGLHVVQSPGGGGRRAGRRRVRRSIPVTRRLANETRGQDLRPGAADAEGRRDPPERRHLRGRPPRVPRSVETAPRDRLARRRDSARGMTTTEQIVWAHRVDKQRRRCGRARRCASTPTCCRPPDGTAPFAIHTFNQITGGDTIYPRQAAIANDHFVFTGKDARRAARPSIGRAVRARSTGSRSPTTRPRATASSTSISPSRGWCMPGAVHPRRRLAQPRVRRVRRGRHRRGLDDARLRLGDRATSTSRWRSSGACVFAGRAAAVGERQGHRARAAAALGREAVAGHVGGVRGREPASCRSLTATRSRT